MKDLSLLSRGCGQVVPSDLGGRMEVTFEPEDFYIWKCQTPLLRVSKSGRLLGGAEPAPPKTYSTRRGHLFLYSEDQVVMAAACQSGRGGGGRKRRVSEKARQEMEQQLKTLRDLTTAILAFNYKQEIPQPRKGLPHPFLPFPTTFDPLTPSRDPQPLSPSPGLGPGRMPPERVTSPVDEPHSETEVNTHTGGVGYRRVKFDLELQTPRAHRSASPDEEPPHWADTAARPTGDPEHQEQDTLLWVDPHASATEIILEPRQMDMVLEPRSMELVPEPGKMEMVLEPRPSEEMEVVLEPRTTEQRWVERNSTLRQNCTDDEEEQRWLERDCTLKQASVDSSWASTKLSHSYYYGGYMSGGRIGRIVRLFQTESKTKRDPALDNPFCSSQHLPPLPLADPLSSSQHLPLFPLADPLSSSQHLPPLPLADPLSSSQHLPPLPLADPISSSQHLPPLPLVDPLSSSQHLPPLPSGRIVNQGVQTHITHTEPGGPELQGFPQRLPPIHESNQHPVAHTQAQLNRTGSAQAPPERYEAGLDRTGPTDPEDPGPRRPRLLVPVSAFRQQRDGGDTQGPTVQRKRGGMSRGGGRGGGRGGRGGRAGERGRVAGEGCEILLEPDEDLPPPVGVIPSLPGRRGPGRQSSLALHHRLLQDGWDMGEGDLGRGLVRGVLPAELTEFQKGRSMGTLIMGPDGEILQLSLWDPADDTGDPSHIDEVTRERALRVLSSEGEVLPWIILLEPEETPRGADKGSGTDPYSASTGQGQQVTQVGSDGQQPTSNRQKKSRTKTSDQSGSYVDEGGRTVTASRPLDKAAGKVNYKGTGGGKETTKNARKESEKETGEEAKKDRGEEAEKGLAKKGRMKTTKKRQGGQPDGQEGGVSRPTTEEEGEGSGGDHRTDALQPSPGRQRASATGTSKAGTNHVTKQPPGQSVATPPRYRDGSIASSGPVEQRKKAAVDLNQKGRGGAEAQEPGNDEPIKGRRHEKRTNKEPENQDVVPNMDQRRRKGKKAESQSIVSMAADSVSGPAHKAKRGKAKRKAQFVVGKPKDSLQMEEEDRTTEMSPPTSLPVGSTLEENEEEEDLDDEDSIQLSSNQSAINDEDQFSSVQSARSFHSTDSYSSNEMSSRRSTLCEEAGPITSGRPSTTSHGHLSSCSAVMATDQLSLNPVRSEASSNSMRQEELAAIARKDQQRAAMAQRDALAQRAEQRRLKVERKRREKEEEDKRLQEREERERRMKEELEEEQRQRTENLKQKRHAEEEERKGRQKEEEERSRREDAEREREKKKQEEKRRQLERLQRIKQEEEAHRAVELERLRLEEKLREEEERKLLQEMDESERMEYLSRKKQEQEKRRREEEERRRREEEAAVWARDEAMRQAEIFARQQAWLEQQLSFRRGLQTEAEALEQTQDISRPWVYSYFTLLQMLGLKPDLNLES